MILPMNHAPPTPVALLGTHLSWSVFLRDFLRSALGVSFSSVTFFRSMSTAYLTPPTQIIIIIIIIIIIHS
jgi:hypothetical protein